MPRLLAIIPEDGWALVRDGDELVFARPPFRPSDRRIMPESVLENGVMFHGYETEHDAPEEPWENVIGRIRSRMVEANRGRPAAPNAELLARLSAYRLQKRA